MFIQWIARLLRMLPNKAARTSTIQKQKVKKRVDVLVDTSIAPVAVTYYEPLHSTYNKPPVYINLHGGAFIMYNKEMDDPYCRYLANRTGCVVINVEYGKAPEHPFPAPIIQLYEVLAWVKSNPEGLNIDPDKWMVGGQSSGANIAAALCLYLKDQEEPQPLLQVLSCAMLDFATPFSEKPEPDKWRSKYPQFAHFLNLCYVPEQGQDVHPYASPVYAENVSGAAETVMITAEYDAFNPEAERYAKKLKKAGVPVHHRLFEDCYHLFTHLGPTEAATEAWDTIAAHIRKAAAESGAPIKQISS
ncbi:alpha/beta hydrolase fold domain-containing protein [Halobacillus litoralis]|uniref:Alpha/beta hydrolase fold domain-containing protein n=1 Tax=Halobacillus litoralis TaxID=45668 RepID=A0A845E1R4_9BACI|nr:alpha/beta hydrolase [Halobacillus litoralis]MYL19644.1 alpha/beta hydrolase fold domain-containing protein [Halobacillus litoralis]MYL37040.1 alpha/beta hydrolase fold domain-containing protein [Halobacillus litoralis]